jgi:hypothetical protein
MEKIRINRFGSITKEENLWCLENVALPETCVLESLSPFPGYYGDVIKDAKPRFVYFILKHQYALEEIVRASMKIKPNVDFGFDISWAQIRIFGQDCDGIRVSTVTEYDNIRILQQRLRDLGFEFKKRTRRIEDEPALIKVKKFFDLEYDPKTKVYLSLDGDNFGYFPFEPHLAWDDFKDIIKTLRNNWTGPRFDAALGLFFQDKAIIDVLRIYAEPNDAEFMNCIGQAFLKKLTKL